MFCMKCGKQIKDGITFCPFCGQKVVDADTQASQPDSAASVSRAAPSTPVPNASNGKKLPNKMIGIIGGAVAVILVLLLAVSSFGGAKGKVGKALVKTFNEYSVISETLGLDHVKTLLKDKAFNLKFGVTLEDAPLKGLGFSTETAFNKNKRAAAFSASGIYESSNMISGGIYLHNNELAMDAPVLLGDKLLKLDTLALGKVLDNLDLTDNVKDVGFNAFDIIDQFDNPIKLDKKAKKKFVKAISVEKGGKREIDVNDHSVKCTQYHVVIPEDAMEALLDSMKSSMKEENYGSKIKDSLISSGIDSQVASEIKDSYKASISAYFDELKTMIDYLGDIELEVYLSNGRIAQIFWKGRIDGEKTEIIISLGGGKNYVDDLTVELKSNASRLMMESHGNHSGKGGDFHTTTELKNIYGNSDYSLFTVDMKYNTKAKTNNFSLELSSRNHTLLECEGTLSTAGKGFSLLLDDVSVDYVDLSAEFSLQPYKEIKPQAKKSVNLNTITQNELENLIEDIQDNAESMYDDLDEEVQDFLYYL